eukprot:TRINITY_DN8865_c0_g2_i4.p2 TRINITY_DN8865_c0_g2~~TRINITY_DN8865_c0_g2_i4.p2  ORF type:complete len:112 (-),score=10.66 TRINITY_DN8865_c0_g2_i4:181-516(-)
MWAGVPFYPLCLHPHCLASAFFFLNITMWAGVPFQLFVLQVKYVTQKLLKEETGVALSGLRKGQAYSEVKVKSAGQNLKAIGDNKIVDQKEKENQRSSSQKGHENQGNKSG